MAVDNFDPFYPRTVKEMNIAQHLRHSDYRLFEVDIRDLEAAAAPGGELLGDRPPGGARRRSAVDSRSDRLPGRQREGHAEPARARRRNCACRRWSSCRAASTGSTATCPGAKRIHVLLPISPYASTKVGGELLGPRLQSSLRHPLCAALLHRVWPAAASDLAIHKFARRMAEGQTIPVFGDGSTRAATTFIDDIVAGIRRRDGLSAVSVRGDQPRKQPDA